MDGWNTIVSFWECLFSGAKSFHLPSSYLRLKGPAASQREALEAATPGSPGDEGWDGLAGWKRQIVPSVASKYEASVRF